MSDNQPAKYPKRLVCEPSAPLARAFTKYKEKKGHTSERKATEALIRSSLEREGFL